MKKLAKILGIAVVLLLVIIVIASKTAKEKPAQAAVKAPAVNTDPITLALQQPEIISKWEYSEDVDKMTSKKSYTAAVVSSNIANFEFPYNGGSTFTLVVRAGKYNDFLIQVSKGQFISSYSGDKQISLRFDNDKPMYVGFSGASDGSSDVIFPEGKSKIISKLKKAKKLLVEAEFYKEGNVVMEFDVSGFEWNH